MLPKGFVCLSPHWRHLHHSKRLSSLSIACHDHLESQQQGVSEGLSSLLPLYSRSHLQCRDLYHFDLMTTLNTSAMRETTTRMRMMLMRVYVLIAFPQDTSDSRRATRRSRMPCSSQLKSVSRCYESLRRQHRKRPTHSLPYSQP